MDNKVLDEAVEVACRERCPTWDGYAEFIKDAVRKEMRAALLAGVKVLLGEPVAWQWRLRGIDTDLEWVTRPKPLPESITLDVACECRTLYAPSLGEGDGR